jgi:hypothetical protein
LVFRKRKYFFRPYYFLDNYGFIIVESQELQGGILVFFSEENKIDDFQNPNGID